MQIYTTVWTKLLYFQKLIKSDNTKYLARVRNKGSFYSMLVGVWKVKVKSLSHVRLCCDPLDCGLSGSSVHGMFQARVLEWVVISFSRGSSWLRDWTLVSHIVGRCFTIWATRKALICWNPTVFGDETSEEVIMVKWGQRRWVLKLMGHRIRIFISRGPRELSLAFSFSVDSQRGFCRLTVRGKLLTGQEPRP